MIFFVAFILLGLILGVGMMLAPALPTQQPRVAAAGVLSLALVMSGALFHAGLFGWNILLVDYLWFALITGVFLGGTLTIGMKRVEEALAAGEAASIGWPSIPSMGIFFGWGVMVLVVLSTFVNTQALLDDAPALSDRIVGLENGADLSELNSITGVIGPGLPALLAYFDTQLPIESSVAVGGWIVGLQVVWLWLVYDLCHELGLDERQTWLAVVGALPVGIWGIDDPIWLTSVVLGAGFGFFALRWLRHRLMFDLVAGAVCAAAAILVAPVAVILLIVLYGVCWALARTISPQLWVRGAFGFALLVVLGISPWLSSL